MDDDEIFFNHAVVLEEFEREVTTLLAESIFEFPEEKIIDIEPDFDFRDYFTRDECGKERIDWWNYKVS